MSGEPSDSAPPEAPEEPAGPSIPRGLFARCDGCSEIIYGKALRENLNVCPRCGFHMRLGARERIESLADEGEFEEADSGFRSSDPLDFRDRRAYAERLEENAARTGLPDAVLVARARIQRTPVVLVAMEYGFIGGSMGIAVGEAIARAAEDALASRLPLVVVSCSGGARMQEGAFSLMQMAKIAAALSRLDDGRLPYISVLTHPTTGGVTASYAMLGDVNIAEPGALIGFAGPRVIRQTIRGELPEGFQRSEFLLEHGLLDAVVPRGRLRAEIGRLLRFMHDPREDGDRNAGGAGARDRSELQGALAPASP